MDHHSVIALLADCGATSAALEAEHEAIDGLLRVLSKAMLAGASAEVAVKVIDMIAEFYSAHTRREEQFLRDHGVETECHAAAHEVLNTRITAVRQSVLSAEPEAILAAADLLNLLRSHASQYDNAAYEQVLRQSHAYAPDSCHRDIELRRLARMRSAG